MCYNDYEAQHFINKKRKCKFMSKIKPKSGFSLSLSTARKEAGFKRQEDFADAINKSLNTVQKWEQGKTKPSLDDFIDLCGFFKCDADYLLGRIEKKTHDLDFVCKYTGLSPQSIEALREIPQWDISSADANSDFDYFISNYGVEFAFHLSEIRHRRERAAIEKKDYEQLKADESYSRFKLSNEISKRITDIELALFAFSEVAREIPANLYDTNNLLKELRSIREKLHEYKEQEAPNDGK